LHLLSRGFFFGTGCRGQRSAASGLLQLRVFCLGPLRTGMSESASFQRVRKSL